MCGEEGEGERGEGAGWTGRVAHLWGTTAFIFSFCSCVSFYTVFRCFPLSLSLFCFFLFPVFPFFSFSCLFFFLKKFTARNSIRVFSFSSFLFFFQEIQGGRPALGPFRLSKLGMAPVLAPLFGAPSGGQVGRNFDAGPSRDLNISVSFLGSSSPFWVKKTSMCEHSKTI